MKRIVISFCLALCIVSVMFNLSYASDYTKGKVTDIIDGKQEYLVLASLGNKDTTFFDVQVEAVIGVDTEGDDSEEGVMKSFEKSISVAGIDSYMYYGENDDKPRTGDNVLISLNHIGGDNYTVKNGIFRVSSVNIEQFKFEVPETINNTPEATELSALYAYVRTNGELNGISIRDDGVYIKNAENDTYQKQTENVGINFLDEFGDPAGMDKNEYPELQKNQSDDSQGGQSKWMLVSIILGVGMVLGLFLIKLLNKMDTGADK